MFNAFTDKPKLAPVNYLPNEIALNCMYPATSCPITTPATRRDAKKAVEPVLTAQEKTVERPGWRGEATCEPWARPASPTLPRRAL